MNFFNTAPKTVDGVLEAFRTTIADLESVATAEQAKAAEQERIAVEALSAKVAAEVEASRAVSIADKMKAIFA